MVEAERPSVSGEHLSVRLHHLDPEAYLRELARWSRDHYLELIPKHWVEAHARLDPAEIEREVGSLTIHRWSQRPRAAVDCGLSGAASRLGTIHATPTCGDEHREDRPRG